MHHSKIDCSRHCFQRVSARQLISPPDSTISRQRRQKVRRNFPDRVLVQIQWDSCPLETIGGESEFSIPRAMRLAARVDPGEGPVEALDLVDQNHRLVVGTARALGCDDEVGLVRIGLHDPWLSQERMNAALARADANEEARRSLGRPKGCIMLANFGETEFRTEARASPKLQRTRISPRLGADGRSPKMLIPFSRSGALCA